MWDAQYSHPFIRGIADGTLAEDRFGFWLRQDYLFLIQYCRVLGVAAARSPNLATLAKFSELLAATATTEMTMHREYAAAFGITASELERSEIAPTTRAYTDFLLRSATVDDFAVLVAALLPCMWGFADLGVRLKADEDRSSTRYATWIAAYSAPEFVAMADWCRQLLDELANGAKPELLGQMAEAFETSSRYELWFWDMAWYQEQTRLQVQA